MNTEERITRARANMICTPNVAFFGSLAMKLDFREDASAQTMATDGTRLFYNPTWCDERTNAELMGLIAHEVFHCIMGHPWRRDEREPDTWNCACDLAINPEVRAAGLQLPPGKNDHREAEFEGQYSEFIYAVLKKEQQDGQPQPKPDYGNDVRDAPPQEDQGDGGADGEEGEEAGEPGSGQDGNGQDSGGDMTERKWQIAAEQAIMVARKQGTMPADLERLIKENRDPTVDWRTVLHRFVEQTIPSDYSWAHPNRRYVGLKPSVYLPGVVKENTPRIDVIVDTSGSTQDLLAPFGGEMCGIMLETRPVAMRFVFCDAAVQHVQEFTPDDGELTIDKFEFRGGGGTMMQPAFDWIAEQDEPPAAIIVLTDLEIDTPTDPGVPTLWVAPAWTRLEGPFGETVRLVA